MMRRKLLLLFGLMWLLTLGVFAQQTTRYIYDDNGRLKAVIAPSGEVALYSYDPAGNLTGIQRIPATVTTNLDFTPKSGAETDLVEIFGTGFATTTTANLVTFNGTSARVLEASLTRLLVEVPLGATTGPINVIAPNGASQSNVPFTVLPQVRVTPVSASLPPVQPLQFFAVALSIPGNTGFIWSVNGVVGGNATWGTISPTGLYLSPLLPRTGIVVRATSASDPTFFGEAQVNVSDIGRFAVAAVSVLRGSPATPLGYRADPVSVQVGMPVNVMQAEPVSAITGPHITSITPVNLPRGGATTITLSGQSFTGATLLKFLLASGATDTAITVSNMQVNTEGTQITATITVSAAAALGNRVVTITTPSGRSSATNLTTNVVQIIP